MTQLPIPLLLPSFLTLIALCALAPKVFAQTDGSPIWSGPFTTGGYIVSSPAVAPDGTIYFGSQDRHLYALAPNGTLKWRFLTGDWVDSSPAIGADGTVYFGSWDGKLYALTPNGTKKWEYSTGVGNYIYSSPAIAADGTIYVGGGDANLHALRPDGSLKWTYPTGDWIDSFPAIGADGTIYFGSWDGLIYALRDAGSSAHERWRHATNGPVIGSPAVARTGVVYVGSNDGRIYALDGASGVRLWDVYVGGSVESSPAVGPDGTVYVGGGSGQLLALNSDGTTRWGFQTVDPIISSPAVRADGIVLVGSSTGVLYAIRPDGTQKWKLVAGDWVDASPVVANNGSIFVGSYDKKLYALNGSGSPASEFSEWPMFRRSADKAAAIPRTGARGRLVNLSTRARVGADESLIIGFVTSGTGARTYLVRAVGPTLGGLGVADPLPDPALALYTSLERTELLLERNDNWGEFLDADRLAAATARSGAFALPRGSRDAALLIDAAPRPHSAVLSSVDGTRGTALAEVYDADSADERSGLANLSTRASIGPALDLLTLGFVVGGDGPLRVLLRAVGPTLAQFGVPRALARPSLTLYSGSTSIATNTAWTTSVRAADVAGAAREARAFSLDPSSADSAWLAMLPPGAYTLQIAGVAGSSGEVLGEIYAIP